MAEDKQASAAFADAIRDRIAQRFGRQTKLATAMGVSPQALSRLLRDLDSRQIKTFKALLAPLGLHLEVRADDPDDPFLEEI